MRKRALVTGCTGQGGSYLVELLVEKGYEVFGLVRRSSYGNTQRVDHLRGKMSFIFGDLCDQGSLNHAVAYCKPHWIFNLACQSYVGESWRQPKYTLDTVAGGTLGMLEAMRAFAPDAKFYLAASSEQFGAALPPQNEFTQFHPRSPYGVAKCAAFWAARNYRESYKLFVSSAINFNNESPRRGFEFVTRKITTAVARIVYEKQNELCLGNIQAKRDWGFSKEYMEAAILMLEQDEPDDYVIGTGVAHTVEEFLKHCFNYVGLNWQNYVRIDPSLIRPAEVDHLLADARKARVKLGWEPKITFQKLAEMMVENDLRLVAEGKL